MPYFEKIEGFSAQFYQVDLHNQTITSEYGKIDGTHTQSSKTFTTVQKAQAAYEKLLNEKKAKGYREPDNTAIPDECINWTPKLFANLPIIRGIHTPPLELVLKPLVILEHPKNPISALIKLKEIILPYQNLIKSALDSHEYERIYDSSLNSITIWTEYIDKLFEAHIARGDGYYDLNRLNYLTIYELFTQGMNAAIILLGTVTALKVMIERLYLQLIKKENYHAKEYIVIGFMANSILALLRHQIALVPNYEYEHLLDVASNFRNKEREMDLFIVALFPTQQAWTEELIDKNNMGDPLYGARHGILLNFPYICSLKHFHKFYKDTGRAAWITPAQTTLWLYLYDNDSIALFDFCLDTLPDVTFYHSSTKVLLSALSNIHTEDAVDVLIRYKNHSLVSKLLSIQARRWPDFIRKKLQK
ncbi:MAG: WGR domain-containing protein [Moraxellaceae bacterium]|nr:WGR domain-containing protein [Moraxellaceae bacterium]